MKPTVCFHCGEPFEPRRPACPHCGADREFNVSEDPVEMEDWESEFRGGMDDEAYEDFLRGEGLVQGLSPVKRLRISPAQAALIWILVAILAASVLKLVLL